MRLFSGFAWLPCECLVATHGYYGIVQWLYMVTMRLFSDYIWAPNDFFQWLYLVTNRNCSVCMHARRLLRERCNLCFFVFIHNKHLSLQILDAAEIWFLMKIQRILCLEQKNAGGSPSESK